MAEIIGPLRQRLTEEKIARREERIRIIRNLILRGFNYKEISEIVGCAESTVVNCSRSIAKTEPKESWEA